MSSPDRVPMGETKPITMILPMKRIFPGEDKPESPEDEEEEEISSQPKRLSAKRIIFSALFRPKVMMGPLQPQGPSQPQQMKLGVPIPPLPKIPKLMSFPLFRSLAGSQEPLPQQRPLPPRGPALTVDSRLHGNRAGYQHPHPGNPPARPPVPVFGARVGPPSPPPPVKYSAPSVSLPVPPQRNMFKHQQQHSENIQPGFMQRQGDGERRGGFQGSYSYRQHLMAPSMTKSTEFRTHHRDNRHYNDVSPNNKVTLFQVFVDKKEKKHGGFRRGKEAEGGNNNFRSYQAPPYIPPHHHHPFPWHPPMHPTFRAPFYPSHMSHPYHRQWYLPPPSWSPPYYPHSPPPPPPPAQVQQPQPVVVVNQGTDEDGPDYTCLLPLAPGRCKSFQMKWYYNKERSRCEVFYFGGCGGNANRFNSLEECQSLCMRKLHNLYDLDWRSRNYLSVRFGLSQFLKKIL